MKLWQKIVLICSCVLLSVVSVLFLQTSRKTRESFFYLSARRLADQQEQAAAAFPWEKLPHSLEGAARRSQLRRLLPLQRNHQLILMEDGEILYSPVTLTGGRTVRIPGMGEAQCLLYDCDGGTILCVGSRMGEGPVLYAYGSVTAELTQYRSFLFGNLIFAAAAVLTGLFAVLHLVRRSMAPLNRLEAAAARIAEGNYRQRTGIRGSDEVGTLAGSFDAMAESVERKVTQLEDTAQRQQRFLSAVTHEFKTPLSGMLLSLDTLQYVDLPEEEREMMLSGLERECRRLEDMVGRLLKLITLGRAPERKPVPLCSFISSVETLAQPMLKARGVLLDTAVTDGVLSLDTGLMETALLNLLENAAKASAPGSRVLLEAGPWGFRVTDQGIGMAEKELSRITEPFYTADPSRCKKQGGIGLGLALVQEIVTAHGGALEFASAPGKGTAVTIVMKP